MISNYLTVLEDSLIKKNRILDSIQEANRLQSELLRAEKLDMEKFDGYVDRKDTYIQELEMLDEGFSTLYDHIREELVQNRGLYAEQIKRLQKLISEVTEKSVSIQAQESRNRDMVAAYFQNERKALGQSRRSSKAALGYYQNLSKASQEVNRIMDLKK